MVKSNNVFTPSNRPTPEGCRSARSRALPVLLKTLFMELDFYLALETFETYYPDGVFARRILMQMDNTGTAPVRLPPEALRGFEYSGTANFMKALADLANALQPGPLPPARPYSQARILPNALLPLRL